MLFGAGLLFALLLAVAPPAGAAAGPPTLSAAEAPGFRVTGSGARAARTALGGAPPSALRGAAVAGSSLRGSGRRTLASAAFTFSAQRRAVRAFGATRPPMPRGSSARRRAGTSVRGIGDGARLWRTADRRAASATIVLREGAAIGVVRLRLPGSGRGGAAVAGARAFAGALAAKLARAQATTPFQATLDGIAPDGAITPALALRAFAIAYGPLPGVGRPRGRALGVPESATLAMQLVARVWDRISPAQRAAVERHLGAPHGGAGAAATARAAGRAGDGAPSARTSVAPLIPSPRFQAVADRFRAFFAAKLPGYNPDVRVFTTADEISTGRGGTAWADALPVNAAGQWGVGAPSYCRVRVPPTGQKQAGKPFFQLIMAHEVFHCFQFQIMTAWRQRSAWLIEGMADWAATSAYATSAAVGAGPYRLYLSTASAPAFSRAYDGTGIWHWLDQSHGVGSLWPNVPLILNGADDGASFVLAGGGDLSFQESWASAAMRLEGAGESWRQTRPYALGRLDPPAPAAAITADTTFDSARYQAQLAVVVADARRPLVGIAGLAGRLRAGIAGRDFGVLDSEKYFCTGICKCPPGRSGEIPPHERVGRPVVLGLTGGALPGKGRVAYHDLDEYCRRRERRSSGRGPSGPAESNGDPHLTSFDGLHFDFQAAGEFLLAKGGDLEVQARQEPYGNSRSVTVNTQIAARVGDRRVTVSPGAGRDDPPVVRIDGQLDPLPAGAPRPFGGGTLARESGQDGWVDITWADGSTLVVRPVGKWGVAMAMTLSGDRAGQVGGVLGDFDGRPGNDLADRGGRAIPYSVRATSGWTGLTRFKVAQEFEGRFFDALYDRFGEAWRISQRESLFDYGPGQSTKTFTLRRIPGKPVDSEELRRQQREEAERICRAAGVTQPGPLEDCIVDVAATGNAAFAEDAKLAQDAASVIWQKLPVGTAITGEIALARAGDGSLVVGWNRDAGGNARQLGAVRIDAAGRAGGEETIAAADGSLGLLTAADGSIRALSAEIPSGASSGVYQYARDGAGAWSPLGLVTGYGSSYAGAPSGVGLPDGGLVTVSPMAGLARVFRGAPALDDGLTVPAPEGCYGSSPSIARDGASGAVWVAWLQWDCPQVGLFAAPYDPATGAFGAPVQAPGSSWGGDYPSLNLDEAVALTARPDRDGLWLAYESGARGDVALWRIGAPRATTLPRRQSEARDVRISADAADGRLWVVWEEQGRLWVQRTGADGAPDGAARPVATPRNDSGDLLRLSDLEISAGGGGLDLVHGLRRGDTPGALSHARLSP
jgi:hypothetical protein